MDNLSLNIIVERTGDETKNGSTEKPSEEVSIVDNTKIKINVKP